MNILDPSVRQQGISKILNDDTAEEREYGILL
jgi:hypothetical protein